MAINPTDPSSMPQMPIYNPLMPLGDPDQNGDSPLPPLTAASPMRAIDKQFSAMIKSLTQQLASLEQQLMQALRQITASSAVSKSSGIPKGGPPKTNSRPYASVIADAAKSNQVDPLLVGAVINQESGYDPKAVSKAGALGLMQLMPGTAQSLGVHDPFDPRQNIEGGTALLRQLLDRYHGQLDLALAAYNAGPGAVDKYGGVPPYPETQNYVRNIMEAYREAALAA